MPKRELFDCSVVILAETEHAYRIDHGGNEPCWVPKSLVEFDKIDGTMTMPAWLAEEKGIT